MLSPNVRCNVFYFLAVEGGQEHLRPPPRRVQGDRPARGASCKREEHHRAHEVQRLRARKPRLVQDSLQVHAGGSQRHLEPGQARGGG